MRKKKKRRNRSGVNNEKGGKLEKVGKKTKQKNGDR